MLGIGGVQLGPNRVRGGGVWTEFDFERVFGVHRSSIARAVESERGSDERGVWGRFGGRRETWGGVSRKTTLGKSSASSKSDRRNKELAVKFEQILSSCVDTKRYPRSEVYISCATMNDDGSASAVLFNSIILALVDAGIPLLDVFVAMCATRLDGETLLDQNEVEERGRGVECFVVAETKEKKKTDGVKGHIGFGSNENNDSDGLQRIVSYDISGGKLALAAVDAMLRACAKGCEEVSVVMRKAMKKRLAKLASTTRNM